MRNIRDVVSAIKAMAGGAIPQGGGRKRGGYTWTRPHSSKRSRMRRLKQTVSGVLPASAFYNHSEYMKAHANYAAAMFTPKAKRKSRNSYV